MTATSSPPRPSATVVLLRDSAVGPEIFMVVRHHKIDFASGALVFPGGSLDPVDGAIAERDGTCAAVAGASPEAMRFRVAAIRESFEECGILLARRRGTSTLVSAADLADLDARYRQPLNAGELSFAELIDREGLVLATDVLVPFAHWITPEAMPKRFDTHFFLAVAPADQLALHDGGEAVDSTWITAGKALEEARNGRYTLVFATERNLFKLEPFATSAAAIAGVGGKPVVTVMPEMTKTETGHQLRIPADAGYGGDIFQI